MASSGGSTQSMVEGTTAVGLVADLIAIVSLIVMIVRPRDEEQYVTLWDVADAADRVS